MKKVVALFLFLIACLGYAANGFQLKYTQNAGTITILDNPKDWVQVYESSGMTLYLNDGGFPESNGFRLMHSKATYKEAEQFANGESIHHIYSYGLVDCAKAELNLVGDLYTNEKFEVIYKKDFKLGQFVADLTKPGTAANAAFGVICADAMI